MMESRWSEPAISESHRDNKIGQQMRHRIFWLSICICVFAACSATAAEPKPTLDELLKEYKSLGLPMPPKEAKLVRERVETQSGKAEGKPQFSLSFVLRSPEERKLVTRFNEIYENVEFGVPRRLEVSLEPEIANDLYEDPSRKLFLAIWCHARGWEKRARVLIEQSYKEAKESPHKTLNDRAWIYWFNQMSKPKIDRAPVAKRLKELIVGHQDRDTDENRALIKSLDLALIPSKAKPGGVDALIDDLVEFDQDPDAGFPWFGDFRSREGNSDGQVGFQHIPQAFRRIARLSFEAVPVLLEHFDDERLTRARHVAAINLSYSDYHYRVGDLVARLIQGLAGEDIRSPENDGALQKSEAQKWWDKARKVGEEKYLLEHLVHSVEQIHYDELQMQNLYLIHEKYPAHLPSIYRMVLEKYPSIDSEILASCIAQSKIPQQEKLSLFLWAMKHKKAKHRLAALDGIRRLDNAKFVELLVAEIDNAPTELGPPIVDSVPNDNHYPFDSLRELTIKCADPNLWRSIEKLGKRAEIDLRIELLQLIGNSFVPKHSIPERLRFLAAFLDDPQATPGTDPVEVRNVAASQFADLLDIEIDVDAKRTPEEWAKLREQMREAVKRELEKQK
jgi:hypothetical protein